MSMMHWYVAGSCRCIRGATRANRKRVLPGQRFSYHVRKDAVRAKTSEKRVGRSVLRAEQAYIKPTNIVWMIITRDITEKTSEVEQSHHQDNDAHFGTPIIAIGDGVLNACLCSHTLPAISEARQSMTVQAHIVGGVYAQTTASQSGQQDQGSKSAPRYGIAQLLAIEVGYVKIPPKSHSLKLRLVRRTHQSGCA